MVRTKSNRAGTRLLLCSALAKIHNPALDIRKPYTEIGDDDAYSGRSYDESFVTGFINAHHLPVNQTTAFLTPAFRNRDAVLAPGVNLVGRPASMYVAILELLDDVHRKRISASDLLTETIRILITMKEEDEHALRVLLQQQRANEQVVLSAEQIVVLIEQHLRLPNTSRLPVLAVAAAYDTVSPMLGEHARSLQAHNAADRQSGALGDLDLTLIGEDDVVASYEMKTRRVSRDDIDAALHKIASAPKRIDHYVFITTERIDISVQEYASTVYALTGGTEMVVLDCIGFVRHFLHLFHRFRSPFLDRYQYLVMNEPASAVSQELKQAFLALRNAMTSAAG